MTVAEYLRVLIERIDSKQVEAAVNSLRSGGGGAYEDFHVARGRYKAFETVKQMLRDSLAKHEAGHELDMPMSERPTMAELPEDEDDEVEPVVVRPSRGWGGR